jgi:L-ascorbate metabolism protein UlaG (beta-lactamase superfamily)
MCHVLIRKITVILIVIYISGCSQYTRDLFWENKIESTPYEVPESRIRIGEWHDEGITYAWMGHATVLINFNGTMLITDPVLHDRIGPPEMFSNVFGIKRLVQLPLEIEQLPAIDLALISHPHFDHLDLLSLRTLHKNETSFVVPYRNAELLDDDFRVIELDWFSRADESYQFNDLTVKAFRVEHYGYIDWGERDEKRGFNGYLISSELSGRHIAFFGDTSFSRYRDENGDLLAKPRSVNWRMKLPLEVINSGIDLCIIPIGDYYYYWNHISPENAVRLAGELNCKKLLPIHYSTFILTPDDVDITEPKRELLRILSRQNDYQLVECLDTDSSYRYPGIGVNCTLP